MSEQKLRSCLILWTAMSLVGAIPQPAAAGPILDWLFPRWAARRAALESPPVTYSYAPAAAAVAGAAAPSAMQQQVLVRYVPQVAYRTVWASVPVTQYRPVTWTDPATGYQLIAMRPCTSYTWQAQRVPYTAYRPVYATGAPLAAVQSSAAPPSSSIPTAVPAPPGCGTYPPGYRNGNEFSPSQTGVPHPSTTIPVPPGNPPLTMPPQWGGGVTLPASPPAATVPPAGQSLPGSVPADRPPSLEPADLPRAQRGAPIGNGSDASRNAAEERTLVPTLRPRTAPGSSSANSAANSAAGPPGDSATSHPSLSPMSERRLPASGLTPIPYLERDEPEGSGPGDVPELLQPRDRTASTPTARRWDAVPISWPRPQARAAPANVPPVPAESSIPAQRPPDANQWNDRGWKRSY